MKKLNYFNQKLEKLQSQKKTYTSIDNVTLTQFIRYKRILSKEKKLYNTIEKKLALGNEIDFWYSTQTKSWIENPNIKPMKYYKLEKNAEYKKNLKLYRLGLVDKRPLPPIIQKIKDNLTPIINSQKEKLKNLKLKLSKYNYFKKIHSKFVYFKYNTLPNKFNKLAVSTATAGIKGYKQLQSNCRYIRNSLSSRDTFKYIRQVIDEAHKRIDICETHKKITPVYQKNNTFRDSIKIENFESDYVDFNNYRSELIHVNPTYSTKLFNSKTINPRTFSSPKKRI